MPDELEDRLERALRAAPPPGADATERALRAALDALPPTAEPRGAAAGGCWCPPSRARSRSCSAASRWPQPAAGCRWSAPPRTHHHPGRACGRARAQARAAPAPRRDRILGRGRRPRLARHEQRRVAARPPALGPRRQPGSGVGGRGRPARAARRRHPRRAGPGSRGRSPGTPLAAAWAPAGIRIAYVVHTPGGDRLYDMYGNGTHAFLVAAHTTAQAPSWRWDSQAFAYIRADGAVMVHNAIDGATAALPPAVRPAPRGRSRLRPLRRPARDRRPAGPGASRRHAPPQRTELCVAGAGIRRCRRSPGSQPRQLVVGRGRDDHALRRRPGRRRRRDRRARPRGRDRRLARRPPDRPRAARRLGSGPRGRGAHAALQRSLTPAAGLPRPARPRPSAAGPVAL